MREPAAGWLTMADDEDPPDEPEFDPRWEVQPAPDVDDESDGGRRWPLIAILAIVLLSALGLWLMLGSAPAV